MKKIKRVFLNWKTSLFGTVAGMPAIMQILSDGVVSQNEIVPLITAVATVILGLIAKDSNVTGTGE